MPLHASSARLAILVLACACVTAALTFSSRVRADDARLRVITTGRSLELFTETPRPLFHRRERERFLGPDDPTPPRVDPSARELEGYTSLCLAPCETTLPTGSWRFAVSRWQGDPVRTPAPLRVEGDVTLRLDHADHGDLRTVGWVLLLTGLLAGPLTVLPGFLSTELDVGFVVTGIVIAALGVGVGMPLIFWDDDASVTVVSDDDA